MVYYVVQTSSEITISPLKGINEKGGRSIGFPITQFYTNISGSLYTQLMNLKSYSSEYGWADFTITKEEMQEFDCSEFGENDFNLIRLFYAIIDMGIKIFVDMIT